MMQSQHSSQVREAIITLRAKEFLYEKIAKSINNAGLGPISKGTVCYNVKKYKETNSKPHKKIDSLKRALQVALDDLDPEMISASCQHAHKRMEAVLEANGGYMKINIFLRLLNT